MKEATERLIVEAVGVRDPLSNKGTYGRVFLLGGSVDYPGSLLLAATGSLAVGAGYVTLGVSPEVYSAVAAKIPEVTYRVFEGDIEKDLSVALQASTIVFGNGLTNFERGAELLGYLLENYSGFLVVDAGGLDAIKLLGLDHLKKARPRVVLTPHLGEFGRLFDLDVKGRRARDFTPVVSDLARSCRSVIDLKDAVSVVSDGKVTYIVDRGNAGLAKAGSGDLLAGMIGGILAYTESPPVEAVAAAHTLMGLAAERLAETKSLHSFKATEVAATVGSVLKSLGV